MLKKSMIGIYYEPYIYEKETSDGIKRIQTAQTKQSRIDYIELQWNRTARGIGNFTALLPLESYDPKYKFVKHLEYKETGIIQKVEYKKQNGEETVTISGLFLESALNWFENMLQYQIKTTDDLLVFLCRTFRSAGVDFISKILADTSTYIPDKYNAERFGSILNSVRYDSYIDFLNQEDIINIEKGSGIADAIYKCCEKSDTFDLRCSLYNPKHEKAADQESPADIIEPYMNILLEFESLDTMIYPIDTSDEAVDSATYTYDDSAHANILRVFLDVTPDEESKTNFADYWEAQGDPNNETYPLGDAGSTLNPGIDKKNTVVRVYNKANQTKGMGNFSRVKNKSTSTEYDITNENYNRIKASLIDKGRSEFQNNFSVIEDVDINLIEGLAENIELGTYMDITVPVCDKVFRKRVVEIHDVISEGIRQREYVLSNIKGETYEN